jgi:hypothetical protein
MLTSISKISSKQAKPTEDLLKDVQHFLQYAAHHPDASITYTASDMILHADSDASFLSESEARSRIGSYLYFKAKITNDHIPSIDINSLILPVVVASACEAEYGGIFITAQSIMPIRIILDALGHPQPATTITTDNQSAESIANNTAKQKRSKAIDMRFHWIRDRIKQKQIKVIWAPGKTNLADYFTKIHPTSHILSQRSTYIDTSKSLILVPQTKRRLEYLKSRNKPTPKQFEGVIDNLELSQLPVDANSGNCLHVKFHSDVELIPEFDSINSTFESINSTLDNLNSLDEP